MLLQDTQVQVSFASVKRDRYRILFEFGMVAGVERMKARQFLLFRQIGHEDQFALLAADQVETILAYQQQEVDMAAQIAGLNPHQTVLPAQQRKLSMAGEYGIESVVLATRQG